MIWFLTHPYLTFVLGIFLLSVVNSAIQGILDIFRSSKHKEEKHAVSSEAKSAHNDSFLDPNIH